MDYKITTTGEAENEIEKITTYISETLQNPSAADHFLNDLALCYGHLTRMPQMYALCPDVRLRALGYRKAVMKNFILVYKVEQAEQTVYVLRVFYGRRDYENLF